MLIKRVNAKKSLECPRVLPEKVTSWSQPLSYMVTPDRVRGGASRRALRCLPRDWKQGYTRTETRPVYRCGDYANRWHTSVVLLLNKSGGGQGRGERIWHADARIKFAGRKRREPQGYLVLPAALPPWTCSRVRVCATRSCALQAARGCCTGMRTYA